MSTVDMFMMGDHENMKFGAYSAEGSYPHSQICTVGFWCGNLCMSDLIMDYHV